MNRGIIFGLGAGALWGLTFLAPLMIQPFGVMELAIARYSIFGIVSVALLLIVRPIRLRDIPAHLWRRLIILAICGNTAQFLLVATAVKLAGSATTGLIIGATPVAMAMIGNLRRPAVPWKKLLGPLLIILASILVTSLFSHRGDGHNPLDHVGRTLSQLTPQTLTTLGLMCALGAVSIWMIYGIGNAEYLADNPMTTTLTWTSLMGVATMLTLPPVALAMAVFAPPPAATPAQWMQLLLWGVILGLGGSWLATALWNRASKTLPAGILGMLIISETLFVLLYDCILNSRLPTPAEAISAALLLVAINWTARGTRRAVEGTT